MDDTRQKLQAIKEERNALVLAHFYQPPDIQDLADIVGDSYLLSREAKDARQTTLVVCGVRFMAESVKLLSPKKTVLMPDANAGCPMADSMTPDDVLMLKKRHPDAAVVCYINTTAKVKAVCDVCCTSANAVDVCRRLPQKKIVFVPDPNLAHHVAQKLPEKEIIGAGKGCPAHQEVTVSDLQRERQRHPQAPVLVHPECSPEVQRSADFVGGTSAILKMAAKASASHCIIGTEKGFLHPLQQACPDKTFSFLNDRLYCEDMKGIKPQDLLSSLQTLSTEMTLDATCKTHALSCLQRMLG